MKGKELGQIVVCDLIDDALGKISRHVRLFAGLLIDGAVVAGEVANVGQLQIDDLEPFRPGVTHVQPMQQSIASRPLLYSTVSAPDRHAFRDEALPRRSRD